MCGRLGSRQRGTTRPAAGTWCDGDSGDVAERDGPRIDPLLLLLLLCLPAKSTVRCKRDTQPEENVSSHFNTLQLLMWGNAAELAGDSSMDFTDCPLTLTRVGGIGETRQSTLLFKIGSNRKTRPSVVNSLQIKAASSTICKSC